MSANLSSFGTPLLVDTTLLTLRPPVFKRSASSLSAASYSSAESSGEVVTSVPQAERKWVAKLRSRSALAAYKRRSVSGQSAMSATSESSTTSSAESDSSTASDDSSVADGVATVRRSKRVVKRTIVGHGNKNRILFERVHADPYCIY